MALSHEVTQDGPWVPEDTFGARLALVRQHLGWNVTEAATACGLTGQSWHNWEAGSLPRDLVGTAAKIAEATGCEARWLVLGQNWKMMNGADLQVFDGEAQVSPGQMTLPFPPLRLVLS
jgi:transcriptional regulator with XRE-family HTH domain